MREAVWTLESGMEVIFGQGSPTNYSLFTGGPPLSNVTAGSYSDTPREHGEALIDAKRVLMTIAILLLILFVTFGNLATLIVICVYKRLRSISNIYLASLATADLFVGLPVMTFMLLYTVTLDGRWVFGDVICDIWTYLDYVSCTTTLTNVCAITGDRFMTLAQPLTSVRQRTKKRVVKVLLCVWLFPMTFWFAVIVTLRVTNGRPANGSCYLIWKPDLLMITSVVGIVYVPLATILILFISILCLLKHHLGTLNHRLHKRAPSLKESLPDENITTTAERAGGISFNPRYVRPQADDIRNISLETIKKHSYPDLRDLVSTAAGPDADPTIVCSDEELYFLKGRKFRTVGTSTSPERFGLVRTIGTNTSPSLHRQKDFSCGSTSVSVPDVANVGWSLTDAAVCLGISSSMSASAGGIRVATTLRLNESDTDTTKTFSTCSAASSTSHSSRTNDSELSLVQLRTKLRTKLRRHYATLLRCERGSSQERTRLNQQLRAARILATLTGVLLLCRLPFSILWPLRTFCPRCISQGLFEASIWTNYMNSAINPIVYCLYNPSFTRAFRRLFCNRCPCRVICRRRHD